jgi:hypothetical protein
MKDYLKNSFERSLKERKEYYLYDVPVYILNPLPPHIDFNEVLEDLKSLVPYVFLEGLEGIYVGEFPELKDRDIQAMLKDGAIYLSSFKDLPSITNEIIVKDIVHELAHLLEDRDYYEIYGDGTVEAEYVGKKKKLVDILRANGISFNGMGALFFSDENVDELDDFLYKQLGYESLSSITPGLFLNPYAVTSIREYFASGFEEYILGDVYYLKEISPQLYQTIDKIMENNDGF